MMKLAAHIAIVMLFLVTGAQAQQFQKFSQYQWLGTTFNPAFIGSENNFRASAVHRSQWSGITDAPRSFQMSLDAPNKNRKMGFGGSIFTDVTGPTQRFGLMGSYAYSLQVSEKTNLRFGLSFGLTQFTIDGSQITLRESGDQSLNNGIQREIKPDVAFGMLWKGDQFYFGISATQLLNNDLDLYAANSDAKMAIHGFLTGAYRFDLDDSFSLEPSFLLTAVQPVPLQADLSARIIYNGNLWLGATYRTSDAIAIFAGYEILNYMTIGYSYDITTSDIKGYSNGSNEIIIQIRFNRQRLMDQNN